MPGFREHIIGSSMVGAGYGAAAWYLGDMPPMTCALGAGLCAASGMLPDLDSGPGVSLRESVAFAAAIIPLLMIHRFQQWGLPLEAMILAGVAIYMAVRFGLTWLLENHATHRGMLHSLPAAAIAGQVTFLAFSSEEPLHRYFVASGVLLGFLSHLVLDEIWAARLGLFGPKVKKSFGTAMKFAGPELWPNLLSYAIVIVLGAIAAADASWTERMANARQHMQHATRTFQQQQQQQQYPQWQFRR
ncbi:MAG: metal-dependent hydrolase [Planctomycetia bacterium]|nr:metal-dependent hydrolase [Planctomycetia bacterium]